jgi:hypothetical protein
VADGVPTPRRTYVSSPHGVADERAPYDAIPLFGRSCSSSLHQRWVCEYGARSLSDRVPVQHCKRATRSLDGRGPAPRPRFSPPETRRDEPGEPPPAGRHRSGWERLPLAMCVSVFLVGMVGLTSTDNPVNVVHSCGIGRSRGKVQLAGPRSAD